MRGYSKLFGHVHISAAQAVALHVKLNGVHIRRLSQLVEQRIEYPANNTIIVFASSIIHSKRF
jgi:hypothetical protein